MARKRLLKMLLLAVAITLTSWASVQADPPPPCDCYSCFFTPNALCDAGGTVVCADWWPPNCNYW